MTTQNIGPIAKQIILERDAEFAQCLVEDTMRHDELLRDLIIEKYDFNNELDQHKKRMRELMYKYKK